MTTNAPVPELLSVLRHAAQATGRPWSDDLADTASMVLNEAAALASNLLAPLDPVGDRHGVRLTADGVSTAPGWPQAYQAWIGGGWSAATVPETLGGQGLSLLLGAACFEIWSGANVSFALAGLLTSGAIAALDAHGSAALKALYLPKLVSGEWPGTMNLTEPQAGSDLGALKCRAERAGDGSYRIVGQKIYITYGDHDMTDNIVHLVLARLPDGRPGTRGLSLFLVPKRLVNDDGALGVLNDVRCIALERKLGMHGAPTCTMAFGDEGGAVGYLIGTEHKGLAGMFTMMNSARLAVGLEGVAAAEHATQKAIAFARGRRQGRIDVGSPEMTPIINHPDVARMLMTMKASTAAARALCYLTAAALDGARSAPDATTRQQSEDRAALLTPLAKAYSTDVANEVASLGVQVHGGMGFIEDTGAAQIMRDIRVAAIYEGTNGIQAIDLVTRKLAMGEGSVVTWEIDDMRRIVNRVLGTNVRAFGRAGDRLADAVDSLERMSRLLAERMRGHSIEALSGATPYLKLFALARGGTSLAGLALGADQDDGASTARHVALARFFAENIAPESASLERIITDGGADLSAWAEAL